MREHGTGAKKPVIVWMLACPNCDSAIPMPTTPDSEAVYCPECGLMLITPEEEGCWYGDDE